MLAIAGLIFMMVFIALPALQRSQRDTRRSDDVSRLQTALNNYQASNRGAIPTKAGGLVTRKIGSNAEGDKEWASFYNRYLLVNAGGQTDTFEDPDGTPYSLEIKQAVSGSVPQAKDKTFKDQEHKILIVTNAVCEGENIKYSSGSRKVAMAYKKEGGGTICVNN